jgi:hypothetical protein
MKKKFIKLVVCAVLFILLTTVGYGGGNGRYIILAHPNQEDLSPRHKDIFENVLLIMVNSPYSFCFELYTLNNSSKTIQTSQIPVGLQGESRFNEVIVQGKVK